jgi:mRNA interferase MazF
MEHDIYVLSSKNNGLKVPSLIRTSKIATIDSALVLGELGELSDTEIAELNKGLRKLLQL